MSKTMIISAAAIGGMAFFSLLTRFSLFHGVAGGGPGGARPAAAMARAALALLTPAGPRRARSSRAKTN